MNLKENVNVIEFLNQVKKCSYDVWLVTGDGDVLNLKSVLSQYVFVVMAEQEDLLKNARLEYDQADREKLEIFLISREYGT